jgi:ectoine hydroxylase-related dioxygenase (phytanoyl-CoA dioxygenase family)
MIKISLIDLKNLEEQGFLLLKDFIKVPDHLRIENKTNIRFCLEKYPELKELSDPITSSLKEHHTQLQLNRSIYFNKSPQNNWSVLWHQDHTLSVQEKFDDPEYSPWSVKEGIHHVQPPIAILNNMVTARLHLDDCNEQNGALKVIPRSHDKGVLGRYDINDIIQRNEPTICSAKKGDLLLIKPLILHSSNSSLNNQARRILHLEFLTSIPDKRVKLYHQI